MSDVSTFVRACYRLGDKAVAIGVGNRRFEIYLFLRF